MSATKFENLSVWFNTHTFDAEREMNTLIAEHNEKGYRVVGMQMVSDKTVIILFEREIPQEERNLVDFGDYDPRRPVRTSSTPLE